jgi:hypothetical protein
MIIVAASICPLKEKRPMGVGKYRYRLDLDLRSPKRVSGKAPAGVSQDFGDGATCCNCTNREKIALEQCIATAALVTFFFFGTDRSCHSFWHRLHKT